MYFIKPVKKKKFNHFIDLLDYQGDPNVGLQECKAYRRERNICFTLPYVKSNIGVLPDGL